MTVVETSIDMSLLRNFFKTFSFSSLSKAPCINQLIRKFFINYDQIFFLQMSNLKKKTLQLKDIPKKFDYLYLFVF